MEQPLVSVVVPSYCHEDHVLECLLSIHDQTYPRLDLVVVDDASRDQSWDRLQALFATPFARRFERVILQRNERNLGTHATLNHGVSVASGQVLALMNSDDLYHPDRLATLVDALMQKKGGPDKAGLAFSLVDIQMSAPGAVQIDPFFRLFTLRQQLALRRDPTVGFALMRANQAVSTGNFVFTRRLWDLVGPFLPLRYCHDWDFLLQSLFFAEPVLVEEPLYTYRLHARNSYAALTHRADIELEVATRRFLRRGLTGQSPNPLFPSASNWPGLFDLFAAECRVEGHLRMERGVLNLHREVSHF